MTNTRTAVADAAYTALVTDRMVAYTSLSAARAVALLAASAYPTGTRLIVIDELGSCSATNTITVNRAGSDTINGATSAVLATAYGHLAIESNGSSKWTIVDQKGGPLAPQAGTTATAPLTLTAGTNLTTPAAGAIEYDGAAFYATVAANERGLLAAEQIQNPILALHADGDDVRAKDAQRDVQRRGYAGGRYLRVRGLFLSDKPVVYLGVVRLRPRRNGDVHRVCGSRAPRQAARPSETLR